MSFSFTMFYLGQPKNKMSKFIQIKTHFGFKKAIKQLLTMYIDRTYIMYLAVPLARADRIQTGIQSVIYMKGQDFSFVY